jgi:hypothetical protein
VQHKKYNARHSVRKRSASALRMFGYKGKGKGVRNRPGVAHRVPGVLGSKISWHSARESGEVVSLYLQECSRYSFSLGAESSPG